MSLKRRALLIVLVVLYLAGVYLVFTGPLSGILPAGYPVLRDILWNYGTLGLFVMLLSALSRFLPNREIPKLPGSRMRLVVLIAAIVINGFIIIGFWEWTPKVSNLALTMTRDLVHYVSGDVADRIINASFAVPVTLYSIVIVLWQIRSWRRQTFSFSWRYGIVTILLLILSTGVSSFAHYLFSNADPVKGVIPSGEVANIVLMLVFQSLVNGFPEELLYRAYIFPQLLAWIRHPLVAGWIMVSLFNASHIPSQVIGHGLNLPWWKWVLWCVFGLQPTGWLFLAIYYRTRSVMPGVIFHTYTTLWAFPFLL